MELPEVTAHDLLVALILAVPPELASRVGRLAALTDTAVPLLFPWGDARESRGVCSHVHWAAADSVLLPEGDPLVRRERQGGLQGTG